MQALSKWNCKKHKYEPYNVPDDWYITTLEDDEDETINCASCGKMIKFGDSYTSKLIHTEIGFGYCVCRECSDNEWKEYLKHKGEND